MLLSQVRQERITMMKSVCGDFISLEDYGERSLEVARQVRSGFDHRIFHEYATKSVLNDLVSQNNDHCESSN